MTSQLEKIYEYDLIPIKDDIDFFSVDAVCYLDLLEVPKRFNTNGHSIFYKQKKYLTVCLHGAPQNLLLNMPNIFNTPFGTIIVGFESKDLPMCISQGKVFNFSRFYRNPIFCKGTKDGPFVYNFKISEKFMIEKYLLPYIKE